MFRNAVIARRACKSSVVFDNFSAALRAGSFQRRRVAQRNCVGAVAFCLIHNTAGEVTDLFHKVFAGKLSLFDLRQFVFPFTGEFGLGKRFDIQALEESKELGGLCRRDQFTSFTN